MNIQYSLETGSTAEPGMTDDAETLEAFRVYPGPKISDFLETGTPHALKIKETLLVESCRRLQERPRLFAWGLENDRTKRKIGRSEI